MCSFVTKTPKSMQKTANLSRFENIMYHKHTTEAAIANIL